MSKNVADHFRWGTALDLAACMGVPQRVATKEGKCQTGSGRVLGQAMTDRACPGKTSMWQSVRDEDFTRFRVSRALTAQVVSEGARDRAQQRQHHCGASLGTAYVESARLPIDVIELQTKHFAGTHAVGGHDEKHREIPAAELSTNLDRTQQSLYVLPWQRTWRAIRRAEAWRNDGRRKIVMQTTDDDKKPEERAERATDPGHRLAGHARTARDNKLVDVDDAD